MNKSIRLRLFVSISGLILFFVVLSLILNNGYLKTYYINQKEKNLLKSSQEINKIYTGDPQKISLALEKIERTRAVHTTIMNKYYYLIYDSQPRIFRQGQGAQAGRETPPSLRISLNDIVINMQELTQGHTILQTRRDNRLGTDFVELVCLLKNDDILVLSTPLAAIDESTAIANRFLLFTGILTVLIGSLMAFIFARRFTRPILQLNNIAQDMAKLDFSQKYQVDSEDEIGELGQSINSLSDQLNKSITGLREANQELLADIEHERKIDRMRKEFVSNVSHELKTPIALIQGYAEGLKVNVAEDEDSKNYYCDVIVDEAAKMNTLVRELLDLSQIESGFFRLEKVEFDLTLLVDQLVDKYRPIFNDRNIRCSVTNNANSCVTVIADITRTEQVLVNYLNNALNHVDEKHLITININFCPDNAHKIRLSVFNSGSPIPDQALDQIWLSFYKVDQARTRGDSGTGLGLSIVKAIQDLHHNKYGVINRDEGVEFWFELDRVV
jgi:signal transduction histidine kinase